MRGKEGGEHGSLAEGVVREAKLGVQTSIDVRQLVVRTRNVACIGIERGDVASRRRVFACTMPGAWTKGRNLHAWTRSLSKAERASATASPRSSVLVPSSRVVSIPFSSTCLDGTISGRSSFNRKASAPCR